MIVDLETRTVTTQITRNVAIRREERTIELPQGRTTIRFRWLVDVCGHQHGGRAADGADALIHAHACAEWSAEMLADWADRHAEVIAI